jgi:hypothetical protein
MERSLSVFKSAQCLIDYNEILSPIQSESTGPKVLRGPIGVGNTIDPNVDIFAMKESDFEKMHRKTGILMNLWNLVSRACEGASEKTKREIADVCCGIKPVTSLSSGTSQYISDNMEIMKIMAVATKFCSFVSEINDPIVLRTLEENISARMADSENFFKYLKPLADNKNSFALFDSVIKMSCCFNNIGEATSSLSRLLGLADIEGFLSSGEWNTNLNLDMLLEEIDKTLNFDIDGMTNGGEEDEKRLQELFKKKGCEDGEGACLARGICSIFKIKQLIVSIRTGDGSTLDKLTKSKKELKELIELVGIMMNKVAENTVNTLTRIDISVIAETEEAKDKSKKLLDRKQISDSIGSIFKNSREFTVSKLTPAQNFKESNNSSAFMSAVRNVIPDANNQEVLRILKTFQDKQWLAFTGRINVEKIPEGQFRDIGTMYNTLTSRVNITAKEAKHSAIECYREIKRVVNGDNDEMVLSPTIMNYIAGLGCGLSGKNFLPIMRNMIMLAGENKKKAEQFTDMLLYKINTNSARVIKMKDGGVVFARSSAKTRSLSNSQQIEDSDRRDTPSKKRFSRIGDAKPAGGRAVIPGSV